MTHQRLRAWSGLVGDALLPLSFFSVWLFSEPGSGDSPLSLNLTLIAEPFALALMMSFDRTRPGLGTKEDWKAWATLGLCVLMLAGFAVLALVSRFYLTLLVVALLSVRLVNILRLRPGYQFPSNGGQAGLGLFVWFVIYCVLSWAWHDQKWIGEAAFFGLFGGSYYAVVVGIEFRRLRAMLEPGAAVQAAGVAGGPRSHMPAGQSAPPTRQDGSQ